MLRWRLVIGCVLIAGLAALVVLDHRCRLPGAWLFPLAVVFSLLAGGELLGLLARAGSRPPAWLVHVGILAVVLSFYVPWACPRGATAAADDLAGWPLAVLLMAAGSLMAAEMLRYGQPPPAAAANLFGGTFALVYVGVGMGMLVQVRLEFGLGALVTLVLVVKLGDIGAYTVGRLLGRRKLAPRISPGKTIEGFLGQMVFCTAGSLAAFAWLAPWLDPQRAAAAMPWAMRLGFGPAMAVVGLLGDLGESLLKREAGLKDSSRLLPGFGGALDLLDSLLLCGPVGWLFWSLAPPGGG